MPFLFGEDSFNTGDSTGVSCMIVKGDLPINIKWTLNGQPLINGENGVTIAKLTAKSSILNIGSVEKEHRGLFRCHAENMAGIAEYSSELHVNGISNNNEKIENLRIVFSLISAHSSSITTFVPLFSLYKRIHVHFPSQ